MNTKLKIAGISLAVILLSFISSFIFYNYMPLSIVDAGHKESFGSTITTINGSDTISSSRAVINTNFSNLNSTKMETTVTSNSSITTLSGLTTASNLSSVGTLTAGVWNGTIITTPYGGTGWGYITPNTVLLGNGSGKIATTTAGVNGQVLGLTAGVPGWVDGVVNQTADYNWTGQHAFASSSVFNGTSTRIANLFIGLTSTTSTASLVSGATSTAHFHPITMGSFTKAMNDANKTGTTTITHNLGITPRMIRITGVDYGANSASPLGSGVFYTYLNGAGQSLYYSNAASTQTNAIGTNLLMYDYAVPSAYQSGSLTVTSTTITISWDKTGSPSGSTALFTWEAYQ
jgi:hypothetical protein